MIRKSEHSDNEKPKTRSRRSLDSDYGSRQKGGEIDSSRRTSPNSSRRSGTGTPRPPRRKVEAPPVVRRSSTFADNPFSKSKSPAEPSSHTTVRATKEPPVRKRVPNAKRTFSGIKKDERQLRERQRFFKRIGFTMLVLILIGLSIWGVIALINSSLFSIDKVEISGNTHVTSDALNILSSVPTSTTTTVLADKKTMLGDVSKHPWIQSAEVKKSLPHTIQIIVKERTPRAVVSVPQKGLWLISSDGVWLDELAADKRSTISRSNPNFNVVFDATGLPVIEDMPQTTPREGRRTTSKEVLNGLRVLSGISSELREAVVKLQVVSVAKTKLFTKEGVEISFGSADEALTKDKIARSILETQKGKVVLINVRTPDKPTWRGLLTE